ncbi:hypothetical protein EON66_03855 [archaeon]|nr:MAG: hypothetical protein EON66_03855 [archaeon]
MDPQPCCQPPSRGWQHVVIRVQPVRRVARVPALRAPTRAARFACGRAGCAVHCTRLHARSPSVARRFNSGTYNNEFLILDYKKFVPGAATLQDGLLWVLDQAPGFISAADLTSTLRQDSYFASYNVYVCVPAASIVMRARTARHAPSCSHTLYKLSLCALHVRTCAELQCILSLHFQHYGWRGAGATVWPLVFVGQHVARQHFPPRPREGDG